jgi:hypothetical protein
MRRVLDWLVAFVGVGVVGLNGIIGDSSIPKYCNFEL